MPEKNNHDRAKEHVSKITKKFLTDYLNAYLFAGTVLWDGDDQYNELPIFRTQNDSGYRVEQRGALLVEPRTARALRMSVVVAESTVQRVCYRITGLTEIMRIDEGRRLYYPLDGPTLDVSISDLNLGNRDISSYSFSNNLDASGEITNKKLFYLLQHMTTCSVITIDDENVFKDLISEQLSDPPSSSDPHYKPIYRIHDPRCGDRD